VHVGVLRLSTSALCCLASFSWAWRGNGDPRPGGNAWLEVECFDLAGRSLGKERLRGGVNDMLEPRFEQARSSKQGCPLSQVVFRGVPPDPERGHGTFMLDDVRLTHVDPMSMLYLVRNGKPLATVVTPDNPDPWTRQAVAWLREYVRRASGADVPVVAESQAPPGALISVGHTRLAEANGITAADLLWDGCRLVVKGEVLFLLGRDTQREYKEAPQAGARGTCRAVLTFLDDYCGVRWFLPTPQGEMVPQAEDILVPRDLAKTAQPAFAYSDGRATYSPGFLTTGGDTPASIINNFRLAVIAVPGGHTYYKAVPADAHFADHPECFALIKGQRTGQGNHLCSSNPEVKRLLIEYTRARLDEGIEWMALGQEDGYLRCECPECEKLDAFRWSPAAGLWEDFQAQGLRDTPCERLFALHKAVIDAVRESHPDRKVMLMCYAPTAWPAKQVQHFGDNVILELMNVSPEYVRVWKGRGSGLAAYIYWFNIQCPMGFLVHATPREVAAKLRYLHECGFVGLYQFAETNWGFQGPAFYVLGKLMGDPALDPEPLVEEYCRGVFGHAAEPMERFFGLLYERLEQVLPCATEDFTARNTDLPRGLTTTDLYLMLFPPALLQRLDELLQQAERQAGNERERGWVHHTRDYFDFTALLTRSLISYRAWQAERTRENWLELRARMEAFDEFRMRILTYPDDYTRDWFPGYAHFCNWLTADTGHESRIYYVPWEKRKAEVMARGTRGMAIGYGGDPHYYSFVREPLTLDFSREPQ
jgi:hypothetical protein